MSRNKRNRSKNSRSSSITTPRIDLDIANQEFEKAQLQQLLAFEKALNSNDVEQIMKAQTYLKTIKKRQEIDYKSILVDPMDLSRSFGYKHKPFNISYDVLRAMSRTHIIRAIIETRKEQVSDFCTPRDNKNGVGFVIQKKKNYLFQENFNNKMSKQEEKRAEQIAVFIMECGTLENSWHADDFDTFVRKIIDDSLTLDQVTFEIPYDRGGSPVEYLATDAATYRIADSYDDDDKNNKKDIFINGYPPTYVQIYQENVIAEFYPWELCFGVRNPSTNIYRNGYGKSELEDMVQTVTAILNADTYNSNFFKVGSAPKGILKYTGNINPNTVEDFRRQWTAQVTGVLNMHKIPLINADKLDFIPTGESNKDMEFSKFQEFLIKISCAMYKIDPAEVGFPMQGTTEAAGLGGDGGTKEKIKYSRSKGLKPLLRKVEKWINKYIVQRLDPAFEFKFVGIEDGDSEDAEQDRDIKALSNYMTVNEIRQKRNLPPVENGDVILNPTYLQAIGIAQTGNNESNDIIDNMYGEEGDQNPFESNNEEEEENPFMKSLSNELGSLLNEDSWN